jgi:squalene-hopene/tetraprenyl-beta-curcumene cyclase
MKIPSLVVLNCLTVFGTVNASPAANPVGVAVVDNGSLQEEVDLALERGFQFLIGEQSPTGSWSNARHPAITSLALLALGCSPGARRNEAGVALERGYRFVRAQVREDGGIYLEGLSNYNTAVCTLALLRRGNPEDAGVIEGARLFLIAQQASGMVVPELNGGIGYGPNGVSPKRQHPDLDNTLVSLEALRACELAHTSERKAGEAVLDWNAAIAFVTRCQNLPESNPQPQIGVQPADKGGFVYYPGFSNAGAVEMPDGRKALRSYGSMSYAGLLSFIYAEVPPGDPRVRAAREWLGEHFTLEENPGLGEQGLYYYYHLMAKALAASGSGDDPSAVSSPVRGRVPAQWARELAQRLVQIQGGNGAWANRNGRWMEADPVLATAYSMLALGLVRERL